MRQAEKDELQAERDRLQARQTADVHRLADAVEQPLVQRRRERLEAAFPAPQRIFGAERGAVLLLRSIRGFADLWRKAVPEAYIREVQDRDGERWWLIACPCGEHPALLPGAIADCLCSRWYFHVGSSVRIKRFEQAAA